MIGKTLTHFRVTDLLGEGGMGKVYRAEDLKLGREVAIKVLPEIFSADPERRSRFEREARVLAAFNHSGIAAIYEVGEEAEQHFLVMELVPGETLEERIARGPLPLQEAIQIAHQIAVALEAAHDQGIIHRDLKPANIKRTPDGTIKILDFGLAKAMDPAGAASGAASVSQLAASPTLTLGATMQGVILGTAAYMSPEQAAGGLADRRSDIWSFGVVIYEMLSGQRLFQGETISHLLAGVLKDEPDFGALPDDLPPRILRLLRRCLRKKPRERLQAIGDARVVIEEVLAGEVDVAPAPSREPPTPTRGSGWPWRVAAALLALSTLALAFMLVQGPKSQPKVIRSQILPPPDTSFFLGGARPGPIALSPDGKQMVFTGSSGDSRRLLWVRSIDNLDARELLGTEDARYPFWSPDSRQVAYFDNSHLNKIAIAGGPPVRLALASNGKGGTWSARGTIIFSPDQASPLLTVSSSGGEVKPLTSFAEEMGESSHRHPRFLPDSEHFLFIARLSGDAVLRIGSLDGSLPETMFSIRANAEYAAGHLLFMRDSTLMAQRFDASSRHLEGEPIPIAAKVLMIDEAYLAVFTVSGDGLLAYQTGSNSNRQQLVWRDRKGQELGKLGEPLSQRHPRLAHDGSRVAAAYSGDGGGQNDVWIVEIERDLRSRFTIDPAYDSNPIWSPDDQQLVFTSAREGGANALWVAPITGTEPMRRLAKYGRNLVATSWSPDGELIVAEALGGGNRSDLVLVSFPDGEISPLIATEFDESSGEISPDGRWLAYRSNETGRDEIFVTSFPTPGRKWQVSQSEGTFPIWRADGRELFYRDSRRLYAAEVDGKASNFEVGSEGFLFDLPLRFSATRQFDVTPDGQRFLINEPIGETDDSPVTLVQNWDVDLPQP